MAALHISASALKLLESCPKAWSYRYLAGHPPEHVTVAQIIGKAAHASLALWLERLRDGQPEATRDDLIEKAEAVIAEAEGGAVPISPDADHANVRTEVCRLITAFLADPLRPRRVLAVETPFSIPLPHHPSTGEVLGAEEVLTGVWDCVVEDADGTLAVIDHKCGRRAPAVEQGIDLQLLIYAIAAAEEFGTSRPIALRHHLLLRTKTPRIDLREVPRFPHDVDEAIEAVFSGLTLIHVAVGHDNPGRLLGRRRSFRCANCCYRRRCSEDRT